MTHRHGHKLLGINIAASITASITNAAVSALSARVTEGVPINSQLSLTANMPCLHSHLELACWYFVGWYVLAYLHSTAQHSAIRVVRSRVLLYESEEKSKQMVG